MNIQPTVHNEISSFSLNIINIDTFNKRKYILFKDISAHTAYYQIIENTLEKGQKRKFYLVSEQYLDFKSV